MQSKILEQKPNPLFHRKEVVVEVEAKAATPRRTEIAAELSEKLGAPATQIAVAKIDHKFGRRFAVVTARVYDSAEQLKKFEHEWVLARGSGKKKAKGAKPAAAAPAAAAPAAEKK
jgi:ribosomal protein S24E